MTPIIDKILTFTISKKLTVFILGTIFMFRENIESEEWIKLAFMYIGTQGVIDIFKIMYNKKK